jgi:cell division protein FtsL
MIELIVAVIGGFAGLFLFDTFTKYQANKRQVELEKEIVKIKGKTEELKQQIKNEDKKAQEKINEITAEQNINVVGDALAEFFNNRKGKH